MTGAVLLDSVGSRMWYSIGIQLALTLHNATADLVTRIMCESAFLRCRPFFM